MALRKPLVINAGQIQQLQSGDTLDAPQGGGDVQVMTNGNAGSVVIGSPVYCSANGTFDKARGNASGTKNVIGLVRTASVANGAAGEVVVSGVLTATTGQWDTAFGTTGGLTKDVIYYLSAATAGLGTATAPSAVGEYVVELGVALSTTELLVRPKSPILL